jgi:hypothetical protein
MDVAGLQVDAAGRPVQAIAANLPLLGSVSSEDFSFVMSTSSQSIEPSSISPAFGSHSEDVYETRSRNSDISCKRYPLGNI